MKLIPGLVLLFGWVVLTPIMGNNLDSLKVRMQVDSSAIVIPTDSLINVQIERTIFRREAVKATSLESIDNLANFSTAQKDEIKQIFQQLFPYGK